MCGRYWIEPDENPELAQIIAEMQRFEGAKTQGEIFPGDSVPVLCKSRAGNVRPFAMEWGWRMADGKRLINARSETAGEKPMFRESMNLRRCLLPMSAYFEWESRPEGKARHRIAPEEKGIHYLAGLYRFENELPVCTVLTRAAALEIAFIHHRMPVILSAGEREGWLHGASWNFSEYPALEYIKA